MPLSAATDFGSRRRQKRLGYRALLLLEVLAAVLEERSHDVEPILQAIPGHRLFLVGSSHDDELMMRLTAADAALFHSQYAPHCKPSA